MSNRKRFAIILAALFAWAASSVAQDIPTSQPDLLLIVVEEIKLGHDAAHRINETGWPAAYERASSPNSYLAFEAMTGPAQVWYVNSFGSHAAMGESFKFDADNAELSAQLTRLNQADAEHVESLYVMHAAARKDLSFGAFPDATKQRFWEVTKFRVRPGGEQAFEAGAKAYGAAAGRAAPDTSYRIYQVIAGVPGPTFLIFSSAVSFGDFDKSQAQFMATLQAMTPQERETFEKFTPFLINEETQRFRLDASMSYVPRAVRDSDPDFWIQK